MVEGRRLEIGGNDECGYEEEGGGVMGVVISPAHKWLQSTLHTSV